MNRVLIVSHDAGGAEVLSAWCAENGGKFHTFYCLAGPALKVFKRDFDQFKVVGLKTMDDFGPGDFVLTGSSLDADLERRAIARARQRGVHCITFLDHWDLYRERFGKPDTFLDHLPDEIWVGDEYAYRFALKEGFPEDILTQLENPYFKKLQRLYAHLLTSPSSEKYRVLYICEPIKRKLEATFGEEAETFDDEKEILGHFLKTLCRFRAKLDLVTLRLHPSEPPDKYEDVVSPYRAKLPLSYSDEPSIVEDIAKHSLVVGIESMGLVIGLLLNKPVFSCTTGKPYAISLPHREIRRINDFDLIFS